jgi:hypothetical protein
MSQSYLRDFLIRCPKNPDNSAEQIGSIQNPNKSAELIGKVRKIQPPIWGGGVGLGLAGPGIPRSRAVVWVAPFRRSSAQKEQTATHTKGTASCSQAVLLSIGRERLEAQHGNVGRTSGAGVKMFKIAQFNVFTPEVKKAGTPHYRFLCR